MILFIIQRPGAKFRNGFCAELEQFGEVVAEVCLFGTICIHQYCKHGFSVPPHRSRTASSACCCSRTLSSDSGLEILQLI